MNSVKLKKYSNQLLSYTALATAFLTTSSFDALSQCGNTLPGIPLEIDIDGDGVTDLTFVQNTTYKYYLENEARFVFGTISQPAFNTGFADVAYYYDSFSLSVSSINGVNNVFNSYGSFYPSLYNTTFPPNPTAVPAGNAFFPDNCPAGAIATADISYGYSYYATGLGLYTNRDASRLYYGSAYAIPGAGNAIVGLSTPINVCMASLNSSNVSLGNNYSLMGSYYYYNFLVVNNFYGTAFMPTNVQATCNGVSAALSTLFNPPANGGYATYIGPINNTYSTVNSNTNLTQYIGVQFEGDADGDGIFETHNGWVAISIDPNSSQITCTGSGYQQCSVEDATQSGESSFACITAGEATNTNTNCTADEGNTVPTLGQWGLIIFALLLMTFGALSLSTFEKWELNESLSKP